MIRLLQRSICAVLLTGCASLPEPPAVEPAVPSGAPWGLAWIPPSGEVAIKAGAVEHVLYPDATPQKPALIPVVPRTSADPVLRGLAAPSPVTRHREPVTRVKPPASLRQCEVEKELVPAWFLSESMPSVSELAALPAEACAVRN